jgi:flagella basal body P-ring formation protein FlgA
MRQLLPLALSLLVVATASSAAQKAETDADATAWVESRLRSALRQSFGLEAQIETLNVLEWAPAVSAFAWERRILLSKSGLRLVARSGSQDGGLEYVWNGTSLHPDSRLETPLRIRFRISAWVERLASQKDILLGEIISSHAIGPVKVAWRPSEPVAFPGCCDADLYLGRKASRTLRQGAVLRPDYFVQAPLVTAGQQVTLISTIGGLSLHAAASAVQSGRTGEVILLKRSDNGVRLRGVIQPDATVVPYDASASSPIKARKP